MAFFGVGWSGRNPEKSGKNPGKIIQKVMDGSSWKFHGMSGMPKTTSDSIFGWSGRRNPGKSGTRKESWQHYSKGYGRILLKFQGMLGMPKTTSDWILGVIRKESWQDNLKSYGRIVLKISGNVGSFKNCKWFYFGGDPEGILDPGSLWKFLH